MTTVPQSEKEAVAVLDDVDLVIDDSTLPSTRNYLLERHGTLELEPMPSSDPEDPYNWPQWRKNTQLALLSFHAFTVTFTAVGIVPAFGQMHRALRVSIPTISYLVTLQILLGGIAPLLWAPVSERWGRRPVALASTLVAALGNVGCALSTSYGAAAFWRCFVAFWLCPPIALGSTIVVEMFFHHERAKKLGVWTLMITLGPPAAPFLMGFVSQRLGYKWIYYVFAITNFVQFAAYLLLPGETRYLGPRPAAAKHGTLHKHLSMRRIDKSRLRLREFYAPLLLFASPIACVTALAYSLVFSFCTVFFTIAIPEIYISEFKLSPQQLGLQFIGMIIGTVIGEQLAGPLSDAWMRRAHARAVAAAAAQSSKTPTAARTVRHEHRLWLAYPGILLAIAGLVEFGTTTARAVHQRHWSIAPLVGVGIASAGVQIVTTILVTYVVDCYPQHRGVVGNFVNVMRNFWGFVTPFFFPEMVEHLGAAVTTGVLAAVIVGVSLGAVVACHVFAGRTRV